jgi:hypothetical protein
MKSGFSKVLTMSDLWNLNQKDTAEFNSDRFQFAWAEELLKSKYPIFLLILDPLYYLRVRNRMD